MPSHNERPLHNDSKRGTANSQTSAPPPLDLNLAHYFLFVLLASVLAACCHLLSAYANTIILAIILAIAFSPIHRRLLGIANGHKDAAALFSCLLLTLVVVLPLFFLIVALIYQGIDSFNDIHLWIKAGEYQKLMVSPLVTRVWSILSPYLPDLSRFLPQLGSNAKPLDQSLLDLTSRLGSFLVGEGIGLLGNLGAIIGKFFLMLFIFYFMIRDEERVVAKLLHLIPLHTSHEEKILAKVKDIARSVLFGTFVTALAQGAAGGLAFEFAGLPGLFWGSVMTFAALVPFVGTSLIWLPAAGYLLILGRWETALCMSLWCLLVVGMMDNLLRPLFMEGAANMNPMLIFLAILGGLHTFGLIGLLYGPLLFGLAMVLLYIYEMQFEPFLNHQDRT